MYTKKARCLTALLASTSVLASSAAFAQQSNADDPDAAVEEIVVTGSRLQNTAVSSPVPILQIGAEEFSDRGVVRIEELLNTLPQVAAAQSANRSNGATGTSQLNLRGLGAQRTLVLINGKRLPFGSPRSSPVNIDIIPGALIERVDIVTGGGSAVYGSDAVGGVANFILKDDFEGIEVDGQVGIHHAPNQNTLMHDILAASGINIPSAALDGREVSLSFTAGTNFDGGRGNVTIHAGYQNANAVLQANRDFSNCALSSGGGINGNHRCAGSSNFRKFTQGVDPDRIRKTGGSIFRPTDIEFLQVFADDGTTLLNPGDPGYDFQFYATQLDANGMEEFAFLQEDDGMGGMQDKLDSMGNPILVPIEANRFVSPFSEVFQEADGTLVPRNTSSEAETFNFGPTNFFRRPNERYNINAIANYQITDTIEIYTDMAFMNNRTTAQIAPSASFNRPFQTNCDNPLLAGGLGPQGPRPDGLTLFELFDCANIIDQAANGLFDTDGITRLLDAGGNVILRENVDIQFLNSHRNVEGGNRISDIDNTQWRIITGLRGTLFNDRFDWDLFGQISKVNELRTSQNDLSFSDVQDALFVTLDSNGNPVCDPSRAPAAGCVPWNIFDRTASGETLVTQEASDFTAGLGITIGRTEQRVIGGTISTDLGFSSPFAESGPSILGGFEYRRDTLDSIPDDISQISAGKGLTGTGGGTLPVSGKLSVWELFMEAQIPLVENRPMMEELSLSGAFRHSEYSTDGNGVSNSFGTNTFFVGGSWMPVDQIRFRAQFQRAIRAPNVINLFTGQNTGLVGTTQLSNGAFEPCAGPSPAATLAQCQNTGLSSALFGTVPLQPAGQLNTVTGGNPNLFAETSDTITIGIVATPDIVPGLTIAIDYWDIQVDDAIGTIPPQTTLDNCIATGNPTFCNLIVRDSFGSLWLLNDNFEGIQATNTNIASLSRSGVDVNISYDMSLDDVGLDGMGGVRLTLAGTYVDDDSFIPLPGEDVVDCNGLFSGQCGIPNSKWRHVFRATWNTPWDLRTTVTWRYTGGTSNSGVIADPTDLNGRVPVANYIDLVFRYQATEALEARFGVNNLLAKQPHFLSQGNNGNIFRGQFDIDRFLFFGVNLSY